MKFRKKPMVIEAVQFTGEFVEGICHCAESGHTHCHTLEGVLNVSPGDWIIRGVNGEFYPCKPDIFEKTYAPAETVIWPDWANYRTIDANGAVYFWAEKPEAWGVTWNRTNARHEQDVNAAPNWRETLEERPS